MLGCERRDVAHRIVVDAYARFSSLFATSNVVRMMHKDELADAPVVAFGELVAEFAQEKISGARIAPDAASRSQVIPLATDESDESPGMALRVIERLIVVRSTSLARGAVVTRHKHHRFDPGPVHYVHQRLGGHIRIQMVVRVDQWERCRSWRFDANGRNVDASAGENGRQLDRNGLARR